MICEIFPGKKKKRGNKPSCKEGGKCVYLGSIFSITCWQFSRKSLLHAIRSGKLVSPAHVHRQHHRKCSIWRKSLWSGDHFFCLCEINTRTSEGGFLRAGLDTKQQLHKRGAKAARLGHLTEAAEAFEWKSIMWLTVIPAAITCTLWHE